MNKKKQLIFASILAFFSQVVLAKHSQITGWNNVIAPKGYILSLDIEKNECSKIWSKQILEFKLKNPHIKNPDFIRIGENLEVQTCKVIEEKMNLASEDKNQIKDNYFHDLIKINRFIEIYGGLSKLSEKDGDSEKSGHLYGARLGIEFLALDSHALALGIGYFKHIASSTDSNVPNYKLDIGMINLDMHYNKFLSHSIRLGGILNIISGNDVSLADIDKSQKVGLYGGLEGLYMTNDSLDITLSLQQRLDEINRLNALTTLGLKFNF